MYKDALLIMLIIISTATALNNVARVNNRKASQQKMRSVRRPEARELRLGE